VEADIERAQILPVRQKSGPRCQRPGHGGIGQRQKHQGYINPEDASFFGKSGAAAAGGEAPAVAHALRIQRNDLESIPLFFTIGLLYVLTGASAFGAAVYCWTFTIARVAHTFF
jgi:uncharacterized membrane protein YecN with MAPEG domain